MPFCRYRSQIRWTWSDLRGSKLYRRLIDYSISTNIIIPMITDSLYNSSRISGPDSGGLATVRKDSTLLGNFLNFFVKMVNFFTHFAHPLDMHMYCCNLRSNLSKTQRNSVQCSQRWQFSSLINHRPPPSRPSWVRYCHVRRSKMFMVI